MKMSPIHLVVVFLMIIVVIGLVPSPAFKTKSLCVCVRSPVWNNTGVRLTFHAPSADKGSVKVCVVLPDGGCHGNAKITYRSSPSCTAITPNSTWARYDHICRYSHALSKMRETWS